MIAPVMLHLALTVGGNVNTGTRIALWICFGLAIGGALVGVALYALGGVRRPPAPSLERWTSGEAPGWPSPRLLAVVRKRGAEPALVEAVAAASTDHDGDGQGSHPPSLCQKHGSGDATRTEPRADVPAVASDWSKRAA